MNSRRLDTESEHHAEDSDSSPHGPKSAQRVDDVATLDETLEQTGTARAIAVALSLGVEAPPSEVAGYRILQRIGEGKYGTVWLARECNTGKQVAIKFFPHRRSRDWTLLCREVEKLAVLDASRYIVRLIEVGWDGDPPYYVMDYLEDGSLADRLAAEALPVAESVSLAKEILRALVFAHGSGILHCDLTPSNVLLDADNAPRLCDFGQARLFDDRTPALGTLFYMPPEQADLDAQPDARWDVYALGAILYQMLVGRPPHRNAEAERRLTAATKLENKLAVYRELVVSAPIPGEHRRVRGVDSRLADIVTRCLHPNPARRYANAQAVLDRLNERDRRRARRPLITLGILAPTLLLLATAPIAMNATHSVITTAREHLTERTLESDALSAALLARGLEKELEDRATELAEIADDPVLKVFVSLANEKSRADWSVTGLVLAEKKRAIDELRSELGRPLDTSWFLTDAAGFQRWREPYSADTDGKNFAHRDYYHGRGIEYDPDRVPRDIQAIQKPRFSTAFRSDATNRYMICLSVPVWNPEQTQVVGVLGRTIHLSELLAEYEARIGVADGRPVAGGWPAADGRPGDRVIALTDSRDWRLLAHRWMNRENLQGLPDETFQDLALTGPIVEQLQQLQQGDAKQIRRLDRSDRYVDPVGRLEPDEYGGYWLAAFAPVGQIGWTAIVQERRETALQPVEELRERLSRYGIYGVVASLAMVFATWAIVWFVYVHWSRDAASAGRSGSVPGRDRASV